MKVFFVNDTSDDSNWGCRATTSALCRLISEAGGTITHRLYLKRMSRSETVIGGIALKTPTSVDFWHIVPAIRKVPPGLRRPIERAWDNLIERIDVVPSSLSDFERCARDVLNKKTLHAERQALDDCDIVVINGEGSIYDRQRKGRMIFFVAYLAKQHFRKPCILVNHTADVSDPLMKEMAAYIYPMLDDVIFREPLSAEQCLSVCNRSDNLAADAAFIYEPAQGENWPSFTSRPDYYSVWPDSAQTFNPLEPYVCVGGSSIYLRPDRPAYDPQPAFERLCLALQRKVGQVVLTAPCRTDERIFRPISKKYGLPLIGLSTPTQQAVDILGHARAYISGRWHPSIFALTGGTPIITLTANTFKTQALVHQVGLAAKTFDAITLHALVDDIVEVTREYIAAGETLRTQLRDRSRELARIARTNVRFLNGFDIPEVSAMPGSISTT